MYATDVVQVIVSSEGGNQGCGVEHLESCMFVFLCKDVYPCTFLSTFTSIILPLYLSVC